MLKLSRQWPTSASIAVSVTITKITIWYKWPFSFQVKSRLSQDKMWGTGRHEGLWILIQAIKWKESLICNFFGNFYFNEHLPLYWWNGQKRLETVVFRVDTELQKHLKEKENSFGIWGGNDNTLFLFNQVTSLIRFLICLLLKREVWRTLLLEISWLYKNSTGILL